MPPMLRSLPGLRVDLLAERAGRYEPVGSRPSRLAVANHQGLRGFVAYARSFLYLVRNVAAADDVDLVYLRVWVLIGEFLHFAAGPRADRTYRAVLVQYR